MLVPLFINSLIIVPINRSFKSILTIETCNLASIILNFAESPTLNRI